MLKLLLVIVFCRFTIPLFAQDRPSSLIWAQPLGVSPSMAGLQDAKAQFRFSHLSQRIVLLRDGFSGSGFENANHSQIGVDMPIYHPLANGGIGALIGSDHFGNLRTNYCKFSFAYVVPLSAKIRYHQLRAGFEIGILQNSVNESAINLESQFLGTGFAPIAPAIPSFNEVRPDLGISLLFTKNQKVKGNPEINYFIGASMHHINRPTFSFTGVFTDIHLPIRYRFLGGVKIRTRSPYDFNYNITYENHRGASLFHNSFFVKYAFLKNAHLFGESNALLTFGFNLRNAQTFIPFVGFEYNYKYFVSFAYELPVSNQQLDNIYFGGLHFQLGLLLDPGLYKQNQHPLPQF
jgi:type IX secretion system PorP/SprF family membrane protein